MLTAKARKCGETADKSLAPFAESTVLFNRLVDITALKVGQYMQPLDENFPAIDAFCVSAGVPWEPEAGREPGLLLLQMTVARKHAVVGQTIKDVIDLARNLNFKNQGRRHISGLRHGPAARQRRNVLDRQQGRR